MLSFAMFSEGEDVPQMLISNGVSFYLTPLFRGEITDFEAIHKGRGCRMDVLPKEQYIEKKKITNGKN